ncbi:hypothetical protein WT59_18090 [Burkholderia territorii]|nr:hypothetical protein WT59_18090 [Burkholderia territorii]
MLTPIVRTAFGAHRGVPRRAVAHTATAAGSPGPAATRAVAAPEPVAPCAASPLPLPLPPEVAAAARTEPRRDALAVPIDPMRRLPLYCAEGRPHAGGGSTERGRVTPAPTLGRAPARATRSATRSNPADDRGARCCAPPAVHCARCRTRPWHPRRARGGINQPRFVRAHIHNLFDEEDKLAYA